MSRGWRVRRGRRPHDYRAIADSLREQLLCYREAVKRERQRYTAPSAGSRVYGLWQNWPRFRITCGDALRIKDTDQPNLTSLRERIQRGLNKSPVILPHPWPEGGAGTASYVIFVKVTGVDSKHGNRDYPGRTRFWFGPVLADEPHVAAESEGQS